MSNSDKLKLSGHFWGVFDFVKENYDIADDCIEGYIDECMTAEEVIEAWLHWNGIMGYTHDIISLVRGMED